jgi:hypothetical protein
MSANFESSLQSFYAGCQAIHQKDYPRPVEWRLDRLQKRVRLVREGSAHCFVEIATGDVLKAAGWKAPAKHARGNIYDESNGLKWMGPFGPAYLVRGGK